MKKTLKDLPREYYVGLKSNLELEITATGDRMTLGGLLLKEAKKFGVNLPRKNKNRFDAVKHVVESLKIIRRGQDNFEFIPDYMKRIDFLFPEPQTTKKPKAGLLGAAPGGAIGISPKVPKKTITKTPDPIITYEDLYREILKNMGTEIFDPEGLKKVAIGILLGVYKDSEIPVAFIDSRLESMKKIGVLDSVEIDGIVQLQAKTDWAEKLEKADHRATGRKLPEKLVKEKPAVVVETTKVAKEETKPESTVKTIPVLVRREDLNKLFTKTILFENPEVPMVAVEIELVSANLEVLKNIDVKPDKSSRGLLKDVYKKDLEFHEDQIRRIKSLIGEEA